MTRPPIRRSLPLGSVLSIALAIATVGMVVPPTRSRPPSPERGTPGLAESGPLPTAKAIATEPAPSTRLSSPAPPAAPSQVPLTTSGEPPASPALDPPAGPGRFAIDLHRKGDFVSQATTEWCVPAAILTMINVIDGADGRDPPSQRRLDRLARALSSPRLRGPGSEPEGWAKTLNRLGYGRYTVVAERTRERALATAARALRLTNRPVGILVWRGAHAWVMTGFEATADPARTDDFRVTRVRVSDPWYPRRAAAWGRPPAPDARITVAALARVYRPWRRPLARYEELDGRFVLVLPVASAP
jgi:hypothetical protein